MLHVILGLLKMVIGVSINVSMCLEQPRVQESRALEVRLLPFMSAPHSELPLTPAPQGYSPPHTWAPLGVPPYPSGISPAPLPLGSLPDPQFRIPSVFPPRPFRLPPLPSCPWGFCLSHPPAHLWLPVLSQGSSQGRGTQLCSRCHCCCFPG